MLKWFLFPVFVLLVGSCLAPVGAQTPRTSTQPRANVDNPKTPIPSAVNGSRAPTVAAKRLYDEGMRLVDEGQLSQAVENLQQALKLEPEYADAYSALGHVYFKLREWQKSYDSFRQASELNSKQRAARIETQQKESTTERDAALPPVQGTATALQTKPSGSKSNPAANALNQPSQVVQPPKLAKDPKLSSNVSTRSSEVKSTPPANSTAASASKLGQQSGTIPQQPPQPKNSSTTSNVGALVQQSGTTQPAPQQKNSNASNNVSAVVQQSRTTPQQPPQPKNSSTTGGPNAVAQQSGTPQQPPQQKNSSTTGNASSGSTQLKPSQDPRTRPSPPAGPQLKPAPETIAAAPDEKLSQKLEVSQRVDQPVSTATKQQATVPQGDNPLVASVRPPNPVAETNRTPVTNSASIPEKTPSSSEKAGSQPVNVNPNGVKVAPAKSENTKQREETAGSIPSAKSNDSNSAEQKRDPAAARVAMSLQPPATALENKSVTPVTAPVSSDAALTKIYRVGPGDVLDVRINDLQSPQSTLFTITSSGLLEHPLLPEPLPVTGFTTEEIGTKIETELSKRALLDNPKVEVGVRDYASHTILVSGLVKDSGTRFLRREAVPLYVVVADAQPLPEAARVTVVRNEANRIYEIDLSQASDMNLLVHSGDVVTLLANVTQFFYIGGEVKSSGEKTFRRGLTLTQAIISSGGFTEKSKFAEIGRDAGRGFIVPVRFTLKDIRTGKVADPPIKPGDRIMILR